MALNCHPNVESGNGTTIKTVIGTRPLIIDCIEVNVGGGGAEGEVDKTD